MLGSQGMAQKLPKDLLTLISYLKKLPGVGAKTAERFAFEFLSWEKGSLQLLGNELKEIQEKIPACSICGCLTDRGLCSFCKSRDPSILCILASPRDVYAIEETGNYRGLYHIIEHLLSPLDGRYTNTLRIDRIEKRILDSETKEIIIAFDSTLEGDTTALFLKNSLSHLNLSISRLAFGLPVGSSLEYVDGGTLARAFVGRQLI